MVVASRLQISMGRPRANDEPWALWSLALAREVNEELSDPATFDAAATRLGAFVAELGCSAVAGISPIGHRLAAAAAAAADVPVWDGRLVSDGRLVLVDAVINTGVDMVGAIRAARINASEVIGVGVVAQAATIATWRAEGETLAALDLV